MRVPSQTYWRSHIFTQHLPPGLREAWIHGRNFSSSAKDRIESRVIQHISSSAAGEAGLRRADLFGEPLMRAPVGLGRLWWMVLAIAASNFVFVQVALRVFGKSGFASVPVVRAGTAAATLGLLVAWWLASNPWNGRFLVSRRTGILALLLIVW